MIGLALCVGMSVSLLASPPPAELELKPLPAQLKGRVSATRFGLVPDTGRDVGPAFRRLVAAAGPGAGRRP